MRVQLSYCNYRYFRRAGARVPRLAGTSVNARLCVSFSVCQGGLGRPLVRAGWVASRKCLRCNEIPLDSSRGYRAPRQPDAARFYSFAVLPRTVPTPSPSVTFDFSWGNFCSEGYLSRIRASGLKESRNRVSIYRPSKRFRRFERELPVAALIMMMIRIPCSVDKYNAALRKQLNVSIANDNYSCLQIGAVANLKFLLFAQYFYFI